MDKISKVAYLRFCVLLTTVSIVGCALQLPPGGGDVDTIPPEIEYVFPADGSTEFDENYFELKFSEYVDKRSVKDAIFISPAIEGNLELSWSGTSVRVYFPAPLKENTTYVVTIGTDVIDFNNRNRMAQAFNLIFSTGTEIDRREISGRLYDENPDGVMMFAYNIDSDTVNPASQKPDYLSQVGREGKFRLSGLSAGTYRVFAVKDEFRDLIFQPEQDKIGIPFKEVTLTKTDTIFSGLNFFLTNVDTVPPRIISATMTDRNHILLNLTKKADSSYIRSDNFFIIDSTSNTKIPVLYAFKGNTKPTEFVLAINNDLESGNNLFVVADTLKDNSGNTITKDYFIITVSDKIDSLPPSMYKMDPPSNTDKVDFKNARFRFLFDDGFPRTSVPNAVTVTDTNKMKVASRIDFIDDASFDLIITSELLPRTDYIINIDMKNFEDAAGNSRDTVLTYKFRTVSGLEFSGIAGILLNVKAVADAVLVLQSMTEKGKSYYLRPGSQKFEFQRIDPGKYLLWGFIDSDRDGKYSHGRYFPYEPSEEFYFYPDTLELRPRWTITDIRFKFDN